MSLNQLFYGATWSRVFYLTQDHILKFISRYYHPNKLCNFALQFLITNEFTKPIRSQSKRRIFSLV